MGEYVGAIDQGTTSTRLILFDRDGRIVALDQREHRQITPQRGLGRARRRARSGAHARGDRRRARRAPAPRPARSRRSASPTSARRPCVWDRETGEPIHNAIVWQDTRTAALVRELAGEAGADRLRDARRAAALDLLLRARRSPGSSTTSPARASAPSTASWPSARSTPGCCGTSPAAPRGGVHATDVTNASRTMLMDLQTLDWHEPSLELMGDPARRCCPRSAPRASPTARRPAPPLGGRADRRDPRRPAGGAVRADLLRARRGQEHLRHRLVPAASTPARRSSRCRRAADERRLPGSAAAPPSYVLEGSIAVTGALVQWLRDQLGLISTRGRGRGARRAASTDNGGVYFVPGVLGPVRAALARRRARRDRRADRLRRRAATSPARRSRRPRGRPARWSTPPARSPGAPLRRAARRRRHDRQRAADAVPGRRARRAGDPPRGRPRRPRSAPPSRPASPSASGPTWTSCASAGARTAAGSPRSTGGARARVRRSGARAVERSLGWA